MAKVSVHVFLALTFSNYFGFDCEAVLDPHANPTGLVMDAMEKYIAAEQKRLDDLRRFSARLRHNDTFFHCNTSKLKDSLSFYVHTNTLVQIPALAQKKVNLDDFKVISSDGLSNALAMFRLQDTYAINTRDMANGNLSTDYSESETLKMTASDCFELGKIAFDLEPGDYYHALLWIQEAYDRMKHEDPPSVDEKDLLVYLSISLYQQGNVERAAAAVMRLKKLAPNFPKVDENLKMYLDELKKRNMPINNLENRLPPLQVHRKMDDNFPDQDIYEKLCRGELRSIESHRSSRQLFCYYKNDNAFLRLAPFKAELVHFEPEITILRKAISKREADIIKSLANSKLTSSVISTTTSIDVAKYRTSKTAWVNNLDDSAIAALSRRVQDISGLTTETAENFQVANYELGGHYMPHFDYAGDDRNHKFANLGSGDRIATVLFYLSNTKSGGATVFPTIRLTVYPQENDAIMWFNLLRNGQGDRRTRHAACPVLIGTKWITNKWMHEYGQEFRRLCSLREDR